ncbi:MAG: polyketide synthase dehydratase domain-containing protein, partial [Verrucomicrobiota bacterium]
MWILDRMFLTPRAQAAVIGEAMERAGVQAGEISYLEAHGTGTSLGDPIEIAGLSKAFRRGNSDREEQWCSIGSLKSNIGHAESAAGIGGLTKVLLQLKHGQLVPSLHSGTLNPNIDFRKTPFRVQQRLEDWETEDGKPRMAGVSSFGAGGSNAHVIIEEYWDKSGIKNEALKLAGPFVIPLSAKNEEQLGEVVQNLSRYLDNLLKSEQLRLSDLAYTLQVSREAMECRLALLVNNLEELQRQLAEYQKGDRKDFLISNIKKDSGDFVLKGKAGKAYLREALANKEGESLAQLWVKGVEIDWNLLYAEDQKPNKISVPTYPFARERYWIPVEHDERFTLPSKKNLWLHPLLHRNDSNLQEQRFTSMYTGTESFLSDHKVRGAKVLPGVVYLELAREAGTRSLEQEITQLKDITWLRPVRVNGQAQTVQISIYEEGERLGYEVYSLPSEEGLNGKVTEEVVHSQGWLSTQAYTPTEAIDIAALQARLSCEKTGKACYASFRELGLDYGMTFQGIATLYYDDNEALSRLRLPKEEGYVLQPGILDSALQTCMGLGLAIEESVLSLPFSVKEVNLYGAVDTACWAYARKSNSAPSGEKITKYDIDLLSEEGEVLLSFKEFVTLPMDGLPSKEEEAFELQYYTTHWKAQAVVSPQEAASSDCLIVLAGGAVALAEHLTDRLECEVRSLDASTAAG